MCAHRVRMLGRNHYPQCVEEEPGQVDVVISAGCPLVHPLYRMGGVGGATTEGR
jgi:hypothetical protein